jgi:hypothetical protein
VPNKEHLHALELNIHDVRMFAQTFIPRWDGYPLQIANGTYIQVKNPLNLSHVLKHLTNTHYRLSPLTIGAYALDIENRAKWVCFDADGDEQWNKLTQLAQALHKEGVIPYLEPSRRGGHLWLFTPLLSGEVVRQFAKNLLTWGNIAGDKLIEIYPKQTTLKDGMGSFVRLPFGVHLKTGKVYHFVDIDGNPLAPTIRDQIKLLGNPEHVPELFIQKITSINEDMPVSLSSKFEKRVIFSHSPLSESLKSAISVFDFVSKYVSLDTQGRGLCPFHEDHMRSFAVNQRGNYWHCFAGCGGGSLIDFWMKWRESHGQSGDFTETVTELREMLLV